MSGSLASERGFSLIDFLIGSLLGGILVAALAGVFQTGHVAMRTASEAFHGDDAVQLLATYLVRDVHGAAPDATPGAPLVRVTTAGPLQTLSLATFDQQQGRVLRVEYVYDGPAGTITRTARAGGTVVTADVLARKLEPDHPTVFTVAPAEGTVTAVVAFRINGVLFERTVSAATRPRTP